MLKVAIAVWVALFCLTAALIIAALATKHWLILEDTDTDKEHSYGLWYSGRKPHSSCDRAEVVLDAKETVYETIRDDAIAALLIIALMVDVVSLALGIIHLRDRWSGKHKGWKMSIPTLVAIFVAADLILIGNLVFLWDIKDAPTQVRPASSSNCANVRNVNLSAKTGYSFFLAIADAAIHVLKAVIFILVNYYNQAKTAPNESDTKLPNDIGNTQNSSKKGPKSSDIEITKKSPGSSKKYKEGTETVVKDGNTETTVKKGKAETTAESGAAKGGPSADHPQESTSKEVV